MGRRHAARDPAFANFAGGAGRSGNPPAPGRARRFVPCRPKPAPGGPGGASGGGGAGGEPMNKEQIASFCERYFAAAGCTILEKTPVHLTVKLSPEADRELTGRDYYWNFVERTGAEPETLSFRFILDPEGHEREKAKSSPDGQPGRAGASGLSVLHGLPPVAPQPGRTPEETLVFGSRRLDQLVASACRRGACLQLFEEPPSPSDVPGIASRPSPSAAAAGPSSPATRSGPPSAALSGAQTSLAAAGPPPAPSANPFSRR